MRRQNIVSEKASKKYQFLSFSILFRCNPLGSSSEHACPINRIAGLFGQPKLAGCGLLSERYLCVCVYGWWWGVCFNFAFPLLYEILAAYLEKKNSYLYFKDNLKLFWVQHIGFVALFLF